MGRWGGKVRMAGVCSNVGRKVWDKCQEQHWYCLDIVESLNKTSNLFLWKKKPSKLPQLLQMKYSVACTWCSNASILSECRLYLAYISGLSEKNLQEKQKHFYAFIALGPNFSCFIQGKLQNVQWGVVYSMPLGLLKISTGVCLSESLPGLRPLFPQLLGVCTPRCSQLSPFS